MTECVIVSKDGSRKLKTIGIELMMPVILNNHLHHVSVSDQLLMHLCGSSTDKLTYGISEAELVRMNLYILFLREDFKRLEIMFLNSSNPVYSQMLMNYLMQFYSFEHLHYWLKVLSDNFTFINMTLANCKSCNEVFNKIPGLINFLQINADINIG